MAAMAFLRVTAAGPRLAFTTLSGEHHELGALMACYIATAERFDCHYFGPDMPVPDLVRNAKRQMLRGLAVSLVRQSGETSPVEDLVALAEALPDDVELWAGVGAHASEVTDRLPARVRTFETFEPFLRQLRALRP